MCARWYMLAFLCKAIGVMLTLVHACSGRHCPPPAGSSNTVPEEDPVTGITRRFLSNGMRLNYRHTTNEPKAGLLRVVFSGGRAAEAAGAGPGGSGAVAIGTRALSESGAMGEWRREQVHSNTLAA